jgi:valyl-tRNA synthetase
LVARIWDWKEQYQARIVSQQQAMGCSCDWDRQRFTMDPVCARAVSWTFFRLFRDGLIFRGTRLVNWDCHLQTAVADDEIVYETVQGHFWHLRYPIIDPQPGEPDHVVVATTRPETMLGDTAVACHPDPRGALEGLIAKTQARLAAAGQKERTEIEAELARLSQRRHTHLPLLERLTAMAKAGRMVRLPLLDRPIPLLCDKWAKPELGSGCVKITPAHDPNDYDVWTRHSETIGLINILDTDGSLNDNAGPYHGLDRFAARDKIVADLESRSLLEQVEDHETEIGHSDRSKTPIEPYLSEQWFVRMGDVEGGVVCGRGTDKEFTTPGLAQAAIDAAQETWRSPSGRQVSFHPDVRYRNTYVTWLAEKRDWCISRQLWWGHRIPIWAARLSGRAVAGKLAWLEPYLGRADLVARLLYADGSSELVQPGAARHPAEDDQVQLLVCLREPADQEQLAQELEAAGFERDPDVLDTWFSSGLWPHSTLGWPDPESARVDDGQTPLGAADGAEDCLSYYYPGSCLVTGRDIITLWVARMVIAGMYNLGDLPFEHCFIHANILDGKGEMMRKSAGNGIDPVDIIERYGADAMRYVMCELQTGSQDIRLAVQAVTLWVARMVIAGMYNLGDLPFEHCFIHANILDGKGEMMRKSAGNGIDPVDIIERYGADAMRYVMCELQTGSQDIRLAVQAVSPFTGKTIELATAKHGRTIFTYLCPDTGKEFDVLGTMPDLPGATLISDRFDVGRAFCTKLWNAARFAFISLSGYRYRQRKLDELAAEDRWILSRLSRTCAAVHEQLAGYRPSSALAAVREFFWGDLCDWYLELIKPRVAASGADADAARLTVAMVLDGVLRLLHPFVPFITETLWARLRELAPRRGIAGWQPPDADLLAVAAWPQPDPDVEDAALEADVDRLRGVARAVRDLRARHGVEARKPLDAVIRPTGDGGARTRLDAYQDLIRRAAVLGSLDFTADGAPPAGSASAVVGDHEVHLLNVVDVEVERRRLARQLDRLQKQVDASERKLANPGFLNNAAAEVIERERQRLADARVELQAVQQNLSHLT